METSLCSILFICLLFTFATCPASDRFLAFRAKKTFWDAKVKQLVADISEKHCVILCHKNPECKALAHSSRTCLMAHTVDPVQVFQLPAKNSVWETKPVYVRKDILAGGERKWN